MIKRNTRSIQALLLDDEPDACRNLQSILNRYWKGVIEISGIAYSTENAEKIISEQTPDVLFIDIEMPGENAFKFLDRISPFPFEIIFVTAYDEYALRALKLNAVDYILKPISLEELEQAILKLEERLLYKEYSGNPDNYRELSNQVQNKENADKIILKSKTETHILLFKDICYLEAEGSYCRFHFFEQGRERSLLMSKPISEYEELLPANSFFRVHKSYLINCAYLAHIRKDDQYVITMSQGSTLPLSRRRHTSLLSFLKNYAHQ